LQTNAALPNFLFVSCTFRADPVHKGDKVVPPATFPPTPPPDPNMIPDELPTISDEVLEEVCQNSTSDDSLLIPALSAPCDARVSLFLQKEVIVDSLTVAYRLEKFVTFSQVGSSH
jgi:hypothetical protein